MTRAGCLKRGAAHSSLAVPKSGASSRHAVSTGQRISAKVLGSPSVSRANGGREVNPVAKRVSRSKWESKCKNTPIFLVDDRVSNGQSLPRVWISEPAYNGSLECCGRELVSVYPSTCDVDGSKALRYAHAYFGEALSYSDSAEYVKRRDCFRAAEVLYLHAAQRGNVEAYVKLGVIYVDDLCEGEYLHRFACTPHQVSELLTARAMECFSYAASCGNAEACWQLADLLLSASADKVDTQRIVDLLQRAFDLAVKEGSNVDKGNAALRLAQCYEAGEVCEHSFRKAYAWYRIAEEELACVVDCGGWYFKRAKLAAGKGVWRMRQELVGGY